MTLFCLFDNVERYFPSVLAPGLGHFFNESIDMGLLLILGAVGGDSQDDFTVSDTGGGGALFVEGDGDWDIGHNVKRNM